MSQAAREHPTLGVVMGSSAYRFGMAVIEQGGAVGELSRQHVFPTEKRLTAIVVTPHEVEAVARIVPVSLIGAYSNDLTLACGSEEFLGLPAAFQDETVAGVFTTKGVILSDLASNYPLATPPSTTPIEDELIPEGVVSLAFDQTLMATDGKVGSLVGTTVRDDWSLETLLVSITHRLARRTISVPIDLVDLEQGVIRSRHPRGESLAQSS